MAIAHRADERTVLHAAAAMAAIVVTAVMVVTGPTYLLPTPRPIRRRGAAEAEAVASSPAEA